MTVLSADEFRAHVDQLQARPSWRAPEAFAVGIATFSTVGDGRKVLDTRYPAVNLNENLGVAAVLADLVAGDAVNGTYELTHEMLDRVVDMLASVVADGGAHPNADVLAVLREHRNQPAPVTPTRQVPVVTFIASLDTPPTDAHDVYLRLHLLSNRRIRPHECSLDGQFALLNNVVWTDLGPCDPDGFEATRFALRATGRTVTVLSVDKFPQMVDYVIPSGVRIAAPHRVRLGAYLGEGTTVMHEGFVNFNAGTEGPAMVEGRLSAGVFIGANTDIGGGASTMGTLSGGGTEVLSIGERCLLGANSGLGISLGDNCVVEAGLYLTGGTIVMLPDGSHCKARQLSGMNDMLFRRNSRTGAVEMIAQSAEWGGLNSILHSND